MSEKERVLVVDDEPSIRKYLQTLLEVDGFEVESVASGKEALERVNMAHRMRHYPAQLSGGQQQRVAVARALAGSPSILLADEPTGNLDSKNGEAVMHLLADLHREGSTICMVTHDPRFAKHAEREVHLFDGKVVSEDELRKLTAEVEA